MNTRKPNGKFVKIKTDDSKIVDLYKKQHKSLKEIAHSSGCSFSTVARRLRENGITLRPAINTKANSSSFKKGRDSGTGPTHKAWKGGRIIDAKGYVNIWCPTHPNCHAKGYVMEHRLIMEKHLGRVLLTEEIVHHINGNPTDNKIENLMLFSSRGDHTSHHWKTTR
jgi:hypothetical protein